MCEYSVTHCIDLKADSQGATTWKHDFWVCPEVLRVYDENDDVQANIYASRMFCDGLLQGV